MPAPDGAFLENAWTAVACAARSAEIAGTSGFRVKCEQGTLRGLSLFGICFSRGDSFIRPLFRLQSPGTDHDQVQTA